MGDSPHALTPRFLDRSRRWWSLSARKPEFLSPLPVLSPVLPSLLTLYGNPMESSLHPKTRPLAVEEDCTEGGNGVSRVKQAPFGAWVSCAGSGEDE